MKVRVKDNERLVRDTNNLAILNTDKSLLKKHDLKMEHLKKMKDRDAEINTLKNEISEIKELLKQIAKR